ncbi:phenazine biosynthesis protein PhzF family [Halosimplex carlsbadense 2-9-1]|uniref:Phenazine biosynthesis protein PhzF family n=1 Tax=Halosimplex carlsbadense 2-9-1 TaxID=797114 RepID=M0CED7_9EURY|nr:PhzF family phenazine biosynthesis protein [Halosimplex carlsbadense]ELZ20249.1 phenazine biosynthesis protein PhzF family [Halosimplex carlsbadense 2-9-1]
MTETRRVQLVDAFTTEPMAGNPAGVVPEAADLADDQMEAIASELGASETAFVLPSDEADHRLRYFTPEREVDLCGHATVAAFASLSDRGAIDDGDHTVETEVGVLDVEVEPDGTVWLTQSPPEVREVDVEIEAAADALGLDTPALSEVGEDLPIARASTGLPFLVVPVGYFEQLSAVDPDMAAIEKLCKLNGAEGLYAFTFDTLEGDATLHGRSFAPLAGIPEDPVTGTASGAVGAYLRYQGALDAEDPLVFEQGHFLDRPGRVLVDTREGEEGETAPRVGGRAVTTLDGDLTVPESDDDDIIEA